MTVKRISDYSPDEWMGLSVDNQTNALLCSIVHLQIPVWQANAGHQDISGKAKKDLDCIGPTIYIEYGPCFYPGEKGGEEKWRRR
jgi:hypothetical protein